MSTESPIGADDDVYDLGIVAATKAGAVGQRAQNVRVDVMCPGFVLTEIVGAMGADLPGTKAKAALLRTGLPYEVAEGGSLPATDQATFVTATIPVDGGRTAKLAWPGR